MEAGTGSRPGPTSRVQHAHAGADAGPLDNCRRPSHGSDRWVLASGTSQAGQGHAAERQTRAIATTSASTINEAITLGMSAVCECLSLCEAANGIGHG